MSVRAALCEARVIKRTVVRRTIVKRTIVGGSKEPDGCARASAANAASCTR